VAIDIRNLFLSCTYGVEEVPEFGLREGGMLVPEELDGVGEE
jgi:hypothetical protein